MIEKFFSVISKYEKDGIDSMDWSEWAGRDVEENIVSLLTLDDWKEIRSRASKESNNIKSLIISVIGLNDPIVAEVQLLILRDFVLFENEDVSFEALRGIVFRFVTSGMNYETNTDFHRIELKGVFGSPDASRLVSTYFDCSFKQRAREIALGCSGYFKDEIITFLEAIEAEGLNI